MDQSGGFGKQGAAFHGQDTVATPRERQIVSDENRSEPVRAVQAFQQFEDHFPGPEIQVAGGFVGEQNRGFPTRARASTTRCCSPPDSSPARCDARA